MTINKAIDKKIDHLPAKEDLAEVKLSLTEDINNVKVDIANVKADLAKWMVSMFVVIVIMILGLFATIIFG